jgi:DNA uptake protein ComE-like DNA-binding protein
MKTFTELESHPSFLQAEAWHRRKRAEYRGARRIDMKESRFTNASFYVVMMLVGLSGCTSNNQNAQQREAEDERMRQEAADTTQKAKENAKQAAQRLDEAGRKLAHQAEVVGQGVKEGWDRENFHAVDLNTGSQPDLRSLPGLSEEDVRKIISGRPYKSTHELVARGIVSEDKFREIGNRIVAKNPTP